MVPFSSGNQWDSKRGASVTPVSTHRNVLMLKAGSAKFIEIPPKARIVIFTFSDDTWVRYLCDDDERMVEEVTSDITDGTSPDFNPAGRVLPFEATVIGLRTDADSAIAQVSFFGGVNV